MTNSTIVAFMSALYATMVELVILAHCPQEVHHRRVRFLQQTRPEENVLTDEQYEQRANERKNAKRQANRLVLGSLQDRHDGGGR